MFNSKRKIKVNNEYFKYFIIDDLFEREYFESMKCEFRKRIEKVGLWQEEYCQTTIDKCALNYPIKLFGGTKNVDSYSEIKSLFKDDKYFTKFLEVMTDHKVLSDVLFPIFDTTNIKIRKKNTKINLFQKIFYNNIRISLKIARYENGSGIGLHNLCPRDKEFSNMIIYGRKFGNYL